MKNYSVTCEICGETADTDEAFRLPIHWRNVAGGDYCDVCLNKEFNVKYVRKNAILEFEPALATRKAVVAIIELQFKQHSEEQKLTYSGREKGEKHHYGRQELRELMDFIYKGEPVNDDERIKA
jgi:hypothetical protein